MKKGYASLRRESALPSSPFRKRIKNRFAIHEVISRLAGRCLMFFAAFTAKKAVSNRQIEFNGAVALVH